MTTPRTAATFAPPIMQAQSWLAGVTHPADRPLINVSQAAPIDPPPAPLRQAMAQIVLNDPDAHLYGPVLGLPALRVALAREWSLAYGGAITADQVAITAGCNQAFTAAIAALCGEGDAVILPLPYYFNHRMWLDLAGVTTIGLPVGPDMVPRVDDCAALITDRTRAIVLVTPNNPTGAEYPAATLAQFAALARARGIKLIVDETYRDFDRRSGAPHDLFTGSDWGDVLVHLYSFSKAYRLTGHRVGALVAAPDLLAEAEKYLDCVTICANQLGQRAALWGLDNLADWVAGERQEILARRAAIETGFPRLAAKGWQLLGCGAYFAYVTHPFAMSSDALAPVLVREAGVLALPGTMFVPDGHPDGARQLRIAFANLDVAGIETLFARLENLSL